jgi:hypothetical protein
MCQGSGRVCPACRGLRFIGIDAPVGHPDFGKSFPCLDCFIGGVVDSAKEMETIQQYLAHPTFYLWENKRKQEEEREAKEAAYRARASEERRLWFAQRQALRQNNSVAS